jgi:hypothetical protein
LDKFVGDSLHLTGSVYRIVGIYQTGDAFEDSGAVLRLDDALELLGKPRQVSVFYIRLEDPGLQARFIARIEREMSDLELSGVRVSDAAAIMLKAEKAGNKITICSNSMMNSSDADSSTVRSV